MAVVLTDTPAVTKVREPGAKDFVRLKLRMLRNGFRGQTAKVIAFVLGCLVGLMFAFSAIVGLGLSGTATPDVGYLVAVFAGTAITLGWTLVPLLFFGVDETIDPARFSLLPIRRTTLARGMLAAAFVGVPAVATLVALCGLVIAAAVRSGALAAVAALVGVVATLTLGVLASRAVTSAFAALLRSRRVRDLAAVIIALLATSLGPIQWTIMAAAQSSSMAQATRVADILVWTPFGAPSAFPFDVEADRWGALAGRVAIVLLTYFLLLRWWSRTLESAMLESSGGGAARARRTGAGGAVSALIPVALRPLARPGPFGAIVAREARFWWRDGRRRAALVSILMASAVLPIALNFGSHSGRPGAAGAGLSFAITMAGTMGGMLLGNQFGFDGSAYAVHLLSRVRGATELRARATAIAVVAVPVQFAVVVAVGLLTGQVAHLPAGIGLLGASFGAAIAAAALLSVLVPYALPENSNPFAVNSGGGSAKGLLSLVAMIGTLIICMPIAIPVFLAGDSAPWTWALMAAGVGYGWGAAWLGTYMAGDVLDRRGPEILAAVTPKR